LPGAFLCCFQHIHFLTLINYFAEMVLFAGRKDTAR